jgi:hypothetical protein
MSAPEPGKTVIGLRTAMLLYAVLVIFAVATLRGNALWITLLIVGALVTKSLVHYFRDRLQ